MNSISWTKIRSCTPSKKTLHYFFGGLEKQGFGDECYDTQTYVIAVPCLSFIFGWWDYPPRNQNTVILWAANYTSIYGIFEEVTDKYDGEDHDGDSHGDFG